MNFLKNFCSLVVAGIISSVASSANSCTFITLTGADGTVVASRTMEWGAFDLSPMMTFVAAGTKASSMKMPDGQEGAQWVTKYDVLGVTMLGQMLFGDGINSEGLNVSLLYLPGFAEYQAYDPNEAEISLAPVDFTGFMLSQFASVAEVKQAVEKIRLVPVVTPELGVAAPVHFSITDKSGDQIVVEYVGGALKVYEKTLGVMTNSPPYDWHINNARNYINMRSVDWPEIDANGIDLAPIGYGTGLLGLPGDFTPPSRFIRALAWTETSRATDGGEDTVHEALRILANFQLPMEATDKKLNPAELDILKYGGTQYTVSYDLKNLRAYFQTSENPKVRSVDFNKFDFGGTPTPLKIPMRDLSGSFATDVTPIR
ncbi:linear amide C-N hydrolase [Pseudopelagicola sp. nBUS_20]|uniref:linear amide C-N hydrolase n=1 Tax=Pseudopelagicola sp. nBUS_20 TaxID=3395317 RepID=UPI003EBD1E5F